MGPQELPQPRHEIAVPAERQSGLRVVLGGGDAQLLQPYGLRRGEGRVSGVGQGRAAPEAERLVEGVGGPQMVSGGQGRASRGGQPFETVDVDVVGVDGEQVARGVVRDEPAPVAEQAPQPGDQGLERAAGAARRGFAVQAVDQPLGGHHPARVQEQHGQQGAQSRPADRDGPPAEPDLQGPQNAEPHRVDSLRRREIARRLRGRGPFSAGPANAMRIALVWPCRTVPTDVTETAVSETPIKRPGGRSARVRAAVLDATLAELTGRGYDGLTVEAVAVRSGVHKATLYRRWGGVDGLVADVLSRSAGQPWQVPDTGSLRDDLRAITHEVYAGFTDPGHGVTPGT
nr:hypothetical protein GCM10020093_046160 [Planobispora longispora]